MTFGSLIVLTFVILMLSGAVCSIVRDRRSGRCSRGCSSCSSGCSKCRSCCCNVEIDEGTGSPRRP